MASCPEPTQLVKLLQGQLVESSVQQLEQHLTRCNSCQHQIESLAQGNLQLPSSQQLDELERSSQLAQTLIGQLSGVAADADDIDAALAALEPSTDSRYIGQIGAYPVTELLGQGNMGIVFKALDPTLHRTVAIKILHPLLAVSKEARTRFVREARSAASLHNEHVVTIFAVEAHGELPFLVMEFVPGESLEQRLESGRQDWQQAARIAHEAARGLAAAHACGLVHRDIKPANLMLDAKSGRVKLTDFGLARAVDDATLTRSGIIAGTPEFMSPEQAAGRTLDARSDLFSLGLVLHSAITGTSPTRGNSIVHTLQRISSETIPELREFDSNIPPWFSDLVASLLQKDPDQRIATAQDLARSLEEHGAPRHVPPRTPRPKRWVMSAGLLTLSMLLLVVIGLTIARNNHWFRESAGAPSPARTEPAPSTSKIPTGFTLEGENQVHTTLAAAISAAAPNAVILVHGDGPHDSAPLDIHDKPLTIRATTDSRPVFRAPSGIETNSPWITTDSDLALEGLEVRWTVPTSDLNVLSTNPLPHSCVANQAGKLTLKRCRIIGERMTACICSRATRLDVDNCQLTTGFAPTICWLSPENGAARIERTAITGPVGVYLRPGSQENIRMQWKDCTLRTTTALRIHGSKSIPRLSVDRCVVDATTLCMLILPRPLRPRHVSEVEGHLQWSEEHNVYIHGIQVFQSGPRANVVVPLEVPLEDWLKTWGLASDTSRLAKLKWPATAAGPAGRWLPPAIETDSSWPVKAGASAEDVGPQ